MSIKYPKIYIIDGTDGCGKSTITNILQEKLSRGGKKKVGIISFPCYQSPMGQIVSDYLHNGYGDIRDRRVASQLYAMDRNLWMRDNFDRYFLSGEYDILIYNRSWISNIIHNTTLLAQTPEDTDKLKLYVSFKDEKLYLADIAQYFNAEDSDSIYSINTVMKGYNPTEIADASIYSVQNMQSANGVTIGSADKVKEFITNFSQKLSISYGLMESILKDAYQNARTRLVSEAIRNSFYDEIDPWQILKDHHPAPPANISEDLYFNKLTTISVPFTDLIAETPIILAPFNDDFSSEVIETNLMKRYNGDESQKDRNEISHDYQKAVIENIYYLYRLINDLASPARDVYIPFEDSFYSSGQTDSALSTQFKYHFVKELQQFDSPTRISPALAKPYCFDIVPITKMCENKPREIDNIVADVCNRWGIR